MVVDIYSGARAVVKYSMGIHKGYKQSAEHIAKRIKSGADHPNWKGDGIAVRSGRTRALRMYPKIGPCQNCGDPRSERHHLDGNTTNNAISNIVPLCKKCHSAAHPEVTERFRAMVIGNHATGNDHAAKARLVRTCCQKGHPYSPENTYVHPSGARICKQCRSDYKREWRAKGNK